jgi:hypothetical protein
MLVKTLKWPFLGVLISGGLHFALVAIFPDLNNFYTPPVLGFVQLAIGMWVGYACVHNGGNFLTALIYAAILGLFPLIVYPLSFGVILGENLHTTLLAGLFGCANFVFGSVVGGGFATSMNESQKSF